MSESDLTHLFRRRMAPFGDVVRIEDRLAKGTPDINYALRVRNHTSEGWVEAKRIERWPAGEGTSVTCRHLTLEQVLWLERRAACGGRAWLLVQIGSAYCLLDAAGARSLYDRSMTSGEVILRSAVYSASGFPARELLEVLAG